MCRTTFALAQGSERAYKTISGAAGGTPRCMIEATPTTLHCSALHALQCNDEMMQRRIDFHEFQYP
jgi:hypothetical protein